MKNWFQNHRLRRQRPETLLCSPGTVLARTDDEAAPTSDSPPTNHANATTRTAVSKISSGRMSIERYLNAPLEDEPASVPAINAALEKQSSVGNRTRGKTKGGHSRESSIDDADSEGQRTFYTSGSAAGSTGTSYSGVSRSYLNHRSRPRLHVQHPPRPDMLEHVDINANCLERPTTSGTIDIEKAWAGQVERPVARHRREPANAHGAKADKELANIQLQAKQLQKDMQRHRPETSTAEALAPIVTDEMAYAQMAAQPKLAWILGADVPAVRSMARPKSSGSLVASTTEERPLPLSVGSGDGGDGNGGRKEEKRQGAGSLYVRKTKSSGALDEDFRRPAPGQRSAALSQRRPGKHPRFYCTFCQKRFQSRWEWTHHEQTIHLPRELWICCPRTGQFPERCPFCERSRPSPSHLADHQYISCQEKPLSQRTFDRQDYFLQHISHVHRVSPSQKPQRLAELAEAWKTPILLREGARALHCGFCGLNFGTYAERTEHVGRHFDEGLDMMSWWAGRVSHEIAPRVGHKTNQDPNLRHKCVYCGRAYENLTAAKTLHPVCSMWSCSFLAGLHYTIYPAGTRENLEAVCCYCNETLARGAGRVKGAVLKEHIRQHNFRTCNQRLYFSGQRFRQHLQDSHRSCYDGTLSAGWPLLLKSSKKTRPAVFEAVEAEAGIRNGYIIHLPIVATEKPDKRGKDIPPVPQLKVMDFSEAPQRSTAPKKLRRKASSQTLTDKPVAEVRESLHFFTRAATIDLAYGAAASPPLRFEVDGGRQPSPIAARHHHHDGRRFPESSGAVDAINGCPRFYRRRLDASTRNRVYVRDESDGPVSKNSQRLFRMLAGSTLGGLVLHSSLVGAVPARLTNSVDIYTLH